MSLTCHFLKCSDSASFSKVCRFTKLSLKFTHPCTLHSDKRANMCCIISGEIVELCFYTNSLISAIGHLACVAGGIRERASGSGAAILPCGLRVWGNLRAAKPRVKFPPATFCTVFACHPLLSLLINQLNKPVRERNVTRNLGLFLSETVQMHATHRK